jgi:transposase InsO family protein
MYQKQMSNTFYKAKTVTLSFVNVAYGILDQKHLQPDILQTLKLTWQVNVLYNSVCTEQYINLDFQNIANKNDGYKYILVVVDVLSRQVFATPTKTKSVKEIKQAFDEIFDNQMPQHPSRLFTDQGKEFDAAEMHEYFKEQKFIHKMSSKDASVKAAMAERMIRTLRQKLYRYFSDNNTTNWVDVLPQVLKSINHSYCRPIGMRPVDVTRNNANALWQRLYGRANNDNDDEIARRRKPNFETNDAVRLALAKPVFRKGTLPTYTDEIFRIRQVVNKGPKGQQQPVTHYYLRDHKGKDIEGRVYASDMSKTREDEQTEYRIERVVKKKGNKLQVKFIGYPDLYWITNEQLTIK